MIQIEKLSKSFDKRPVINDISLTVDDGTMYGLVGSNGAGKSTLLRLLSGVYKPDSGSISYGGEGVWDNPKVKGKIVFITDELYLPPSQSIKSMAALYKAAYKSFDTARLYELTDALKLDPKASFNTFSKGMRRQAATALGLSARPEYLLLDETLDGLDVVMRGVVKQVIYSDMAERGATVILTSHSLKELEDCCDRLALLHDGGIVLDSELSELGHGYHKVQIAFDDEFDKERFRGIDTLSFTKSGKVASFIVKGDKEDAEARLKAISPKVLDVLPLSPEEVFACVLDYSYYDTNAKI